MISVDVRRMAYNGAEILHNVRFELADGESLAILGPSGIGKTTLLRIVAGSIGKYEGEIRGVRRLAMVFQEPTLLPWRSAIDNLTLTTEASPQEAQSVLEATRRIREQGGRTSRSKDLPIIALTANALEGDRARCLGNFRFCSCDLE